MRFHAGLLPLLAVGTTAFEFQLPFSLPFFSGSVTPQPGSTDPVSSIAGSPAAPDPANRIAIIGAGAGGSSAAFWLGKARERAGLDLQVDVYERSDYIGGRDTIVHPYDDPSLEPLELGGSIFVKSNKNLWRATDEFGLERLAFGDDEGAVLGLWDGAEFILSVGGSSFYSNWWTALKVWWRYGFSAPRVTQAIVDSMLKTFVTLYAPDAPRFANVTSLADSFGWSDIAGRTTAEHLDAHGVNPKWTRELVDAMTRVNYGQDVDAIHALEGLVSLAANGASGVKGGNFQIFENFLARSNASVHLNTTVHSISRASPDGPWTVHTSAGTAQYRAVILAAPFHSSGIALSPAALAAAIPAQPYVQLHVTLLTTTSPAPSAAYFGLKGDVPTEVLTTWERVRAGGAPAPEFNSLTYHGRVARADGAERAGADEWTVKIFSKERVSDEWLAGMFGTVGWVHRKEWDAYPVLPPTSAFPPVKLDRGLFYVNAFEPFISTMETETISSRNVVDLLLQEEFGAGICGKAVTADDAAQTHEQETLQEAEYKSTNKSSEFVLGWDC
ncbi:FAD/NAD(P)-binding domain-containing protein [Amylocystis lapponica]|nr:FAD/NAD(P)-binding domain-containing protein [Amylocystis lapponica]